MRIPAGQALTQAQQRMQREGSVSTFMEPESRTMAPVGQTAAHSPQSGQPSAVTGTAGTAGLSGLAVAAVEGTVGVPELAETAECTGGMAGVPELAVTAECAGGAAAVPEPEGCAAAGEDVGRDGSLYGRFPLMWKGANAPGLSSLRAHSPPKMLASARSMESGRPSAIGIPGVL